MNNDLLMKDMRMSYFIISIAIALVLVPSFALISSSQTNDTLSDDTLSDDTLSDDTLSDDTLSNDTFSSLSREFAQNQSGSDDEVDQAED